MEMAYWIDGTCKMLISSDNVATVDEIIEAVERYNQKGFIVSGIADEGDFFFRYTWFIPSPIIKTLRPDLFA